jgi:hypothetical protein
MDCGEVGISGLGQIHTRQRPIISMLQLMLYFFLDFILSGYWLILIRRRGAVFSNYVFSTEILFFVLSSWVSLILAMSRNATAASVGMSLGAVAGIGNMGTVLQLLTGYPVLALVALNLARRHVDRNRSWNAFQPSRPVGLDM